jgi:ribosome-associated toxin RatA of RatAB toxin-antitoxin module
MSITVTVHALTDVHADEAFRRLADYRAYPQYAETVRSVELDHHDGRHFSTWRVGFRGGVLCWTEEDEFDPVTRTLGFSQVDGDLERFDGRWEVEPFEGGSSLTFTAELDLGIPTLAPIVDPVARKALQSNIRSILRGLFGANGLDLDPVTPTLARLSG